MANWLKNTAIDHRRTASVPSCHASPRNILCALAVLVWITRPAFAGVVEVPPQTVEASGIELSPLHTTRYFKSVEGIATVVDPQPLFSLAANLSSLRAAAVSADAQVISSGSEASRLEKLKRTGVASQHAKQITDAAAASAKAQQVSASEKYASAIAGGRSQWGTELTAIAQQGVLAMTAYLTSQTTLFLVAVPPNQIEMPSQTIDVQASSSQSLTASLVGASPVVDPVVQGPSYFYRSIDISLRSGQRLNALVPLSSKSIPGVVVPGRSVIWYAGEPWVYIQRGVGSFVRKVISTDARVANGWFQKKGFHDGDIVVTHGATLLLSEELKPPAGSPAANGDGGDGD